MELGHRRSLTLPQQGPQCPRPLQKRPAHRAARWLPAWGPDPGLNVARPPGSFENSGQWGGVHSLCDGDSQHLPGGGKESVVTTTTETCLLPATQVASASAHISVTWTASCSLRCPTSTTSSLALLDASIPPTLQCAVRLHIRPSTGHPHPCPLRVAT